MSADAATLPVYRTRWFRAGLALAGAGWLALVWNALCVVPGVPWNPARLAPSFAVAQGLPIYALRDSGQQLGWFYGPVFPLWNLPITLTENPTLAVMLAGLINVLTMLVPFALVLWGAGVARGWWLAGATLIAGMLLGSSPVTHAGFYFVHVDLICLALGALACVAVHRAATGGHARWVAVAALAGVLAFWTKQIALPLLPAMFLWLWFEGRRRLIGPLLFWCAVLGGIVSVAIFAYFGAAEVLFDTYYAQTRNPWKPDAGELLVKGLAANVLYAWAWLALFAWAWWDRRASAGAGGRAALPERAASLVRLLLWAAACQLPLGLVASLKAGGGNNSLHSTAYLCMAAMIFFCDRWAQPATRAARVRPAVVFALAMIASVVASAQHTAELNFATVWTPYRGLEDDLAMVRKAPGKIYLPWNPLITLIAERRIYPFDDALYCLWLCGLEPPREKVWAAVPAGVVLFYHEPAQSHFALEHYFMPGMRPRPQPAEAAP